MLSDAGDYDPVVAIARRENLLLLCYHAISHDWRAPLSVSPARLREHLSRLQARGFEAVTFTEAVSGPPRGKRMAITFDDGCRSVYEVAWPILAELGITATLFVPTDFIGRSEPMSWPGIEEYGRSEHASELLPMSWDQTRELADAGWEIGSHTRAHSRLTDLDDGMLAAELIESRTECEARLGRPCTSIAFPYGDVDNRVAALAGRAGYVAGAALMNSEAEESKLAMRRIGLHEPDGKLAFGLKTSRLMQRAWRSPAWTAISWVISGVRG